MSSTQLYQNPGPIVINADGTTTDPNISTQTLKEWCIPQGETAEIFVSLTVDSQATLADGSSTTGWIQRLDLYQDDTIVASNVYDAVDSDGSSTYVYPNTWDTHYSLRYRANSLVTDHTYKLVATIGTVDATDGTSTPPFTYDMVTIPQYGLEIMTKNFVTGYSCLFAELDDTCFD